MLSLPELFPRWPFDSLPTNGTNNCSQTRMAWSLQNRHSWVSAIPYLRAKMSTKRLNGLFAILSCVQVQLLTSSSWSRCWYHRGCPRRHSHGSRQDSSTSTTPLYGRSARRAQVPKRSTCSIHSVERGGCWRIVARCVAHGTAPGYEPSCQLHSLFRAEGAAAEIPEHKRPTRLADILHRSHLWCHGAFFECTHRHNQNKAAKDTRRARAERYEQDHCHCSVSCRYRS